MFWYSIGASESGKVTRTTTAGNFYRGLHNQVARGPSHPTQISPREWCAQWPSKNDLRKILLY
jgi:hypothetical protein